MSYKSRLIKDKLAAKTVLLLVIAASLLVVAIIAGLYIRSRPILAEKPLWDLLFSSAWRPLRGQFGFYPFLMGSLWVTGVAILIATPLSLLTSLFLSEYAPRRFRNLAKSLIDLLAGIPSVVFGVWGVLAIVPFVKDTLAPMFGLSVSGYCVLSAGLVLAVMIFPIIIHVCLDVLGSVPVEIKEASLSLGATHWQTIKFVIVRKALPGIIAAVVLGLSRAFGETMAVLMVAGNVSKAPHSLFDPAYPLPALIANNFGEMLSIPLYDSALLFSALLLMGVVLLFSMASRVVLIRIENRVR